MKDKKVLIVGGGVTGLFSAYFLVKNGFEVTIIDDGPVPGRHSCSTGNAGLIVPSHFVPIANKGTLKEGFLGSLKPGSAFGINGSGNPGLIRWLAGFFRNSFSELIPDKTETLAALHLESRDLFQRVQASDIPCLSLELTGLLMVSSTRESFDKEKRSAEQSIRLGIPAEVWSPEKFHTLNAELQSKLSGAVYYPLDGKVDPFPMLINLAAWLKANGVSIFENTRVTGWHTVKNQVTAAKSHDREFKADEFIICGGDQSGAIASLLGCKIPLQPGKGISFDFANSGPVLSHPALLMDHHIAITPYENHTRLASGFLLGNRRKAVSQDRLSRIHQSVNKVLPGLKITPAAPANAWVGFRPVSPDGMPIIGRSTKYANLLTGTGHAMMGISLGPVSGSILSDLITGTPIKPSYSRFLAPSRFGNSF
jgi:D-amino-acid dehydrogenase